MTTVRDAMELGAAVREARLSQGLSQGELARKARVGRQWVVGVEAGGKQAAPLDMILRVLQALSLDVTLLGSSPARGSRTVTDGGISADAIVAQHTRGD